MDPESVLRRYVEAGDAGDCATVRRLLAGDLVTHVPGGDVVVGGDAQEQAWRRAHAGLADLTHRVVDVLVRDDLVAARVDVTARHVGPFLGLAASGATLAIPQALFARVDGDVIVEMWEIVDTGAALRQVGALGDQPLSP